MPGTACNYFNCGEMPDRSETFGWWFNSSYDFLQCIFCTSDYFLKMYSLKCIKQEQILKPNNKSTFVSSIFNDNFPCI